MTKDITIRHEAKDIPCVLSLPEGTNQDSDCGLILTHGAGGDLHTKQLKDITDRMVTKGWTVLRFTCRGHINHRAKVFGTVMVSTSTICFGFVWLRKVMIYWIDLDCFGNVKLKPV